MKLVLPRQVSAADRYAAEVLGNDILDMIDSAAEALFERCAGFRSVTVLCGGGNNGADGLCAARKLMKCGVNVTVRIVSRGGVSGINDNCRHYYGELLKERCGVKALDTCGIAEKELDALGADIERSDALLECILGTGYVPERGGSAEKTLHKIFDVINEKAKYVVSADIPAGVNGENGQVYETAVKADETVTFAYMKPGHVIMPGKSYCGRISVTAVRVPREAYAFSTDADIEFFCSNDEKTVKALLPERDPYGHKGSFGKTLIIAGSEGMTGAAILSARACIGSGAGLCYLAAPRGLLDVYEAAIPEIVKIPLGNREDRWLKEEFAETLLPFSENADSVVIGPGIGRRAETAAFVNTFLKACPCDNIIVDADALRVLRDDPQAMRNILEKKNAVVTPHWGELNFLLGETEHKGGRLSAAKKCSEVYGVITVCKGNDTVTYKDEKTYTVNGNGNSGMATAGSGDVLSGIIGAFLASGMNAYDAARAGVFVHGLAGDIAEERLTEYAVTASDIIGSLGESFRRILR